MITNRYLRAAFYSVAALLIVLPAAETLVNIWPVQPRSPNWRFGATGYLSRALVTPVMGLLLFTLLAATARQRRMLRVIAVLAGFLTVALVSISAVFIIDALQVRAQVPADAHQAFDTASVMALVRIGAASVVALLFALGGWVGARYVRGTHGTGNEDTDQPLLRNSRDRGAATRA
jgi:hypothetical protein